MDNRELITHIQNLPDHLKKEAEDFIEFLLEKSKKSSPISKKKKQIQRKRGRAKGLIKMTPDFNEPLEDFKEYMK